MFVVVLRCIDYYKFLDCSDCVIPLVILYVDKSEQKESNFAIVYFSIKLAKGMFVVCFLFQEYLFCPLHSKVCEGVTHDMWSLQSQPF